MYMLFVVVRKIKERFYNVRRIFSKCYSEGDVMM